MKNKLILLLCAFVVFVLALVACGDAETTTSVAETTKAPLVVTAPPGEKPNRPVETEGQKPITTPLDGDDALAAYLYVCENMASLKGFDMDMTENQIMGDETHQISMDMKLNYLDGMRIYVHMPIDEDGGTIDITVVDGMAYCVMDASGMRIKYKTRDVSMTGDLDDIAEAFKDQEKKCVSAKWIGRKNGIYTLEVIPTQEEALNVIMHDFEGSEIDASMISDIDMLCTYQINEDGYIISGIEEVICKVNGVDYQMQSSITFKNIGKVPNITVPADADDYMDMDAM